MIVTGGRIEWMAHCSNRPSLKIEATGVPRFDDPRRRWSFHRDYLDGNAAS